MKDDDFSSINLSKANFDEIYSSPDPRAYFAVLGALDYMIPDLAEPVIRQVLRALAEQRRQKPLVLDVGCSYGVNAALHRHPVSFNTLRRRYTRQAMATLDPEALVRLDRSYFESWPDVGVGRFIGLDSSAPAVQYARAVGLLEDGLVADLERRPLSEQEAASLRGVDAIVSTGCVGYVTQTTFRRLLGATARPPWIISFVLRMFPYEGVSSALAEHGLVTERLIGATFSQRRFRDQEEFERSLAVLRERGLDPTGLEADGLFQAELFLSRPEEDVRARPLSSMVTVSSGRHREMGARYVLVEAEGQRSVLLEP